MKCIRCQRAVPDDPANRSGWTNPTEGVHVCDLCAAGKVEHYLGPEHDGYDTSTEICTRCGRRRQYGDVGITIRPARYVGDPPVCTLCPQEALDA